MMRMNRTRNKTVGGSGNKAREAGRTVAGRRGVGGGWTQLIGWEQLRREDQDRRQSSSPAIITHSNVRFYHRPTVMMSQFSFVALSDVVQDGVSSVKRLAQRRLHSAPPALQLRPILQDVPTAAQWLWGREPISGRRSFREDEALRS